MRSVLVDSLTGRPLARRRYMNASDDRPYYPNVDAQAYWLEQVSDANVDAQAYWFEQVSDAATALAGMRLSGQFIGSTATSNIPLEPAPHTTIRSLSAGPDDLFNPNVPLESSHARNSSTFVRTICLVTILAVPACIVT